MPGTLARIARRSTEIRTSALFGQDVFARRRGRSILWMDAIL
jgi:hypothetical protein